MLINRSINVSTELDNQQYDYSPRQKICLDIEKLPSNVSRNVEAHCSVFYKKRRETVVLKKDQCLMRVKQNAPNSAW